jgi:hypothetical protein
MKRTLLLWLVLSAADLGYAAASAGATGQYCVPKESCCKVCTTGKACGDSCINAGYDCQKGEGCACDNVDVCRAH